MSSEVVPEDQRQSNWKLRYYPDEDAAKVKLNLISSFGAKEQDIHVLASPLWQECKDKFKEIQQKIRQNWVAHQKRTLVFVYAAAHGIVGDNFKTSILLNTSDKANMKVKFELEMNIETLAGEKGCFAIGLFDCCRERFEMPKSATRGGEELLIQPDAEVAERRYKEGMITFGCPIGKRVSGESTLVNKFFEILYSNKVADFAVLPGRLLFEETPNRGKTENFATKHANIKFVGEPNKMTVPEHAVLANQMTLAREKVDQARAEKTAQEEAQAAAEQLAAE